MKIVVTNLALDDSLIEEVVALGGFKAKKSAATQTLEEFVQRLSRRKSCTASRVRYRPAQNPRVVSS